MNVLSLFDGLSCGRIALERAGVKVDNYYSAEIDVHAIKVADKNWPQDTPNRLGDVTKIKASDLPQIDLLIGGSPCQGFSLAGKQLAFDDPRSKLFFEYVRLLKELNPKYFMLENVRMKKEFLDIITEHLGVEPIAINSNLLSAQNRLRFYWTNIPGVEQPDDKGIQLFEVLVDDVDHLLIPEEKWMGTGVEKYLDHGVAAFTERRTEEAKRIRKEHRKKHGTDFSPRRGKEMVPRTDGKMNCLTATYSIKEHSLIDSKGNYRKLDPIECERLQTVPDNYTDCVSSAQRYKMLGNGWTVDAVAHIFNGIEQ